MIPHLPLGGKALKAVGGGKAVPGCNKLNFRSDVLHYLAGA